MIEQPKKSTGVQGGASFTAFCPACSRVVVVVDYAWPAHEAIKRTRAEGWLAPTETRVPCELGGQPWERS